MVWQINWTENILAACILSLGDEPPKEDKEPWQR